MIMSYQITDLGDYSNNSRKMACGEAVLIEAVL